MSLANFLLKYDEVYGTIYLITNQINNKKYIGQTTNEKK